MTKKDVKLFFEEVSKNETLKKELEKAEEGMTKIKENELESFFNEKISPIVQKYGFDFSFNDVCEYKRRLAPENSDELSDDELFNVAGGLASCTKMGWGLGETIRHRGMCLIVGVNFGG